MSLQRPTLLLLLLTLVSLTTIPSHPILLFIVSIKALGEVIQIGMGIIVVVIISTTIMTGMEVAAVRGYQHQFIQFSKLSSF